MKLIAPTMIAAAAVLALSPASGAAPIEVLIRLPASGAPALIEALPKAETEILSLLGSGAVAFPCPDSAPCRRYIAPEWNPKTVFTRQSRLDQLKAFWGGALTITEGLTGVASEPRDRAIVDWTVRANKFTDQAMSALNPAGQPLLYDGSRGGSLSDVAVEATGAGAMGPVVLNSGPAASPRRTAPPAPRSEYPYQAYIEDEALAAGVEPAVIHAIVVAKSNYDADREGGGAQGLMMISPGAAKAVGLKGADLSDPQTNLRVGSRLLAMLLKRFDGDLSRALAAYQVGTAAVVESGGIPNRRDVKIFLADFEAAYRKIGGVRPPAVVSPLPALREVKDRIVEQIKPDPANPLARFRPMIKRAAARRKIDPDFFEALISVENSDGDPRAVSSEGAIGLGQLMPETAKMLGVKDPYDPEQNLNGAARHFAYLLTHPDVQGNYVLAAAAYNAGEGRIAKYKSIPPFRETMNYVKRICARYEVLTGKAIDYEPYLPVLPTAKKTAPAKTQPKA